LPPSPAVISGSIHMPEPSSVWLIPCSAARRSSPRRESHVPQPRPDPRHAGAVKAIPPHSRRIVAVRSAVPEPTNATSRAIDPWPR
jgi:hypothetical protein